MHTSLHGARLLPKIKIQSASSYWPIAHPGQKYSWKIQNSRLGYGICCLKLAGVWKSFYIDSSRNISIWDISLSQSPCYSQPCIQTVANSLIIRHGAVNPKRMISYHTDRTVSSFFLPACTFFICVNSLLICLAYANTVDANQHYREANKKKGKARSLSFAVRDFVLYMCGEWLLMLCIYGHISLLTCKVGKYNLIKIYYYNTVYKDREREREPPLQ